MRIWLVIVSIVLSWHICYSAMTFTNVIHGEAAYRLILDGKLK